MDFDQILNFNSLGQIKYMLLMTRNFTGWITLKNMPIHTSAMVKFRPQVIYIALLM